jgi:hypothetical protein
LKWFDVRRAAPYRSGKQCDWLKVKSDEAAGVPTAAHVLA